MPSTRRRAPCSVACCDEGVVVVVATQRCRHAHPRRRPDPAPGWAGCASTSTTCRAPRWRRCCTGRCEAPVAAAAEHQLWTTTAGNPLLFLRELVDPGRRSGGSRTPTASGCSTAPSTCPAASPASWPTGSGTSMTRPVASSTCSRSARPWVPTSSPRRPARAARAARGRRRHHRGGEGRRQQVRLAHPLLRAGGARGDATAAAAAAAARPGGPGAGPRRPSARRPAAHGRVAARRHRHRRPHPARGGGPPGQGRARLPAGRAAGPCRHRARARPARLEPAGRGAVRAGPLRRESEEVLTAARAALVDAAGDDAAAGAPPRE